MERFIGGAFLLPCERIVLKSEGNSPKGGVETPETLFGMGVLTLPGFRGHGGKGGAVRGERCRIAGGFLPAEEDCGSHRQKKGGREDGETGVTSVEAWGHGRD